MKEDNTIRIAKDSPKNPALTNFRWQNARHDVFSQSGFTKTPFLQDLELWLNSKHSLIS